MPNEGGFSKPAICRNANAWDEPPPSYCMTAQCSAALRKVDPSPRLFSSVIPLESSAKCCTPSRSPRKIGPRTSLHKSSPPSFPIAGPKAWSQVGLRSTVGHWTGSEGQSPQAPHGQDLHLWCRSPSRPCHTHVEAQWGAGLLEAVLRSLRGARLLICKLPTSARQWSPQPLLSIHGL